jgi:endonuclease YncB( thermonuclease family)
MTQVHFAILTVLFAFFGFTINGLGQRVQGQVTEVTDGRTLKLRVNSSDISVTLQFVETPSDDQPLAGTVRDHLSKLALGRTASCEIRGVKFNRSFGRVVIDGRDLSQQMLRDGAAWLIPHEISGQSIDEYQAYQKLEAAAKSEKRGVWSVSGLMPSWLAEQTVASNSGGKNSAIQGGSRIGQKGKFGDKNPLMGDVGALAHGYNAETRVGYLSTTALGIKIAENSPWFGSDAAIDISYIYKEDSKRGRVGRFYLTVVRISDEKGTTRRTDLYFLDRPNLIIAKAVRRTAKDASGRYWEQLRYELPRNVISRVINDGSTRLGIGDTYVEPAYGFQLLLFNMLQLSR